MKGQLETSLPSMFFIELYCNIYQIHLKQFSSDGLYNAGLMKVSDKRHPTFLFL